MNLKNILTKERHLGAEPTYETTVPGLIVGGIIYIAAVSAAYTVAALALVYSVAWAVVQVL